MAYPPWNTVKAGFSPTDDPTMKAATWGRTIDGVPIFVAGPGTARWQAATPESCCPTVSCQAPTLQEAWLQHYRAAEPAADSCYRTTGRIPLLPDAGIAAERTSSCCFVIRWARIGVTPLPMTGGVDNQHLPAIVLPLAYGIRDSSARLGIMRRGRGRSVEVNSCRACPLNVSCLSGDG